MAKYGNRESYDLALEYIKKGKWAVDAENGLILGSTWDRKPIGTVRDGYVRVRLGYKLPTISAHRVIWEYVNGESDLNLTVNHIDGNGLNNRIDNLELCTNKVNSDHAHKTLGRGNGSRNKGSVNPRARLNEDQVRTIKSKLRNGENYRAIAEEFGVSPLTIHSIKRGANWSHIE